MKSKIKLGILGSTRGSNLIPLSKALMHKKVPFTIAAVISNQIDAPILTRAKEFNWPSFYYSPANQTREEYDALLSQQLQASGVDLVILMGYMRILSSWFVNVWRHKVMNVHPSLLPAFAGKMDKAIHQAVLEAGLGETGCTVHEVNEIVDEGSIIIQKKCQVFANDTVETLKARVQSLEVEALAEAVQSYYQRELL